ncbi:MAG: hypothetical protein K6T65_13555 [Peptococcaceae bacterium]|nr:hypothetical protein [Peptococcaceae bacterium]
MSEKTKKVFINGVEYEKEEIDNTKTFSRLDQQSKMKVVNVFSTRPDSGSCMEAFKKSVAAFLCKCD